MQIALVAGNPKPASRTLEAARLLARALTGREPAKEVDVITLGSALLGWGDEAVASAVAAVAASDLAIVASPTSKGTYSGVLKLFLDQFDTGTGLAGVTAIPLMLGAGPAHYLAPELLLKPVLVELGAVVPVQGLYVGEKTYDQPEAYSAWIERWGDPVLALADRSGARREPAL